MTAKLFQVALNVNNQGDVENDGHDHEKDRDDPERQREHHESHGDGIHGAESIVPEFQIESRTLDNSNQNDSIDNLPGTICKQESLPT